METNSIHFCLIFIYLWSSSKFNFSQVACQSNFNLFNFKHSQQIFNSVFAIPFYIFRYLQNHISRDRQSTPHQHHNNDNINRTTGTGYYIIYYIVPMRKNLFKNTFHFTKKKAFL